MADDMSAELRNLRTIRAWTLVTERPRI